MTSSDEQTIDFRLTKLTERHVPGMLAIFNHHVAEGFAAYPEEPLTEEEIRSLLHQAAGDPAVAADRPDGTLLGFGFLRPYSP